MILNSCARKKAACPETFFPLPARLLSRRNIQRKIQGKRKHNKTPCLTGKTLADSLDDGVVLNVIGVIGLQLSSNSGEGSLEGLLGGSVDHLGLRWSWSSAGGSEVGSGMVAGYLNAGIIRGPGNKGDFVSAIS